MADEFPLSPGDRLQGFCGGWFGRDSYDTKTVMALGPDWVVCREEGGDVVLATGDGMATRLLEFRR